MRTDAELGDILRGSSIQPAELERLAAIGGDDAFVIVAAEEYDRLRAAAARSVLVADRGLLAALLVDIYAGSPPSVEEIVDDVLACIESEQVAA